MVPFQEALINPNEAMTTPLQNTISRINSTDALEFSVKNAGGQNRKDDCKWLSFVHTAPPLSDGVLPLSYLPCFSAGDFTFQTTPQ